MLLIAQERSVYPSVLHRKHALPLYMKTGSPRQPKVTRHQLCIIWVMLGFLAHQSS